MPGAIIVPAPVVAEVGYLLGRAGGAKIEAAFLRSIVQETFTILDLELIDYERMAASCRWLRLAALIRKQSAPLP